MRMKMKVRILKQKIESLRKALHLLLLYKEPTDKMVVVCSQHLDKFIVEYQKFKSALNEVA